MFWMLLHVVWGNVRHLLAPSCPIDRTCNMQGMPSNKK